MQSMEEGTLIARSAAGARGGAGSPATPRPSVPQPAEVEMSEPAAAARTQP